MLAAPIRRGKVPDCLHACFCTCCLNFCPSSRCCCSRCSAVGGGLQKLAIPVWTRPTGALGGSFPLMTRQKLKSNYLILSAPIRTPSTIYIFQGRWARRTPQKQHFCGVTYCKYGNKRHITWLKTRMHCHVTEHHTLFLHHASQWFTPAIALDNLKLSHLWEDFLEKVVQRISVHHFAFLLQLLEVQRKPHQHAVCKSPFMQRYAYSAGKLLNCMHYRRSKNKKNGSNIQKNATNIAPTYNSSNGNK